jgi:tetratricopeptide (TPR) repeat protein
VRRVAAETLGLEPDLLVVYLGNNEVVGPYGPGSAATDAVLSTTMIRLSLVVRSTRTGQLIQRLAARVAARRAPAPEWRGMEMFAGRTVAAEDPRLARVYEQFQDNLTAIVAQAGRRGVPVVVSTVAVNVRDCAPFASVPGAELALDRLRELQQAVAEAREAIDLGRLDQARSRLEFALGVDRGYAEAHYLLGVVLENLGRGDEARPHFLEAWQRDALRFRADSRINAIIREVVAAHSGAVLVDAATVLGSPSTGSQPLAGRRYFFEHVHLTFEGNAALAALIADAVPLPGRKAGKASGFDLAELAERTGFTPYGELAQVLSMNALMRRPPFTGQVTFAEDQARHQGEALRLEKALGTTAALQRCAGVIEAAARTDAESPFLAFHLASLRARLGQLDAALGLNARAAALAPPSPEIAAQRAYLLLQAGRAAEAEALLLQSQENDPYYFQTYGLLAQTWLAQKQAREGATWFSELAGRMPASRVAHELQGQLLYHAGDPAGAEAAWRKTLSLVPDADGAWLPLTRLLLESNRVEDALQLLEAAHRSNPRNLDVAAALEQLFDQRGDIEKRARYLRAMAEAGPVSAALFLDLGLVERARGEHRRAQVAFERAVRAARSEADQEVLERALQELAASPSD